MKRSHWLAALVLVVGIGAALSISAATGKGKETEKDVTIDQVPAAVKQTILKQAGDNKIEEIEEVSLNGEVKYYEAEWQADGKEIEIQVAPDGKLLSKEVEEDDDGDNGDDDD